MCASFDGARKRSASIEVPVRAILATPVVQPSCSKRGTGTFSYLPSLVSPIQPRACPPLVHRQSGGRSRAPEHSPMARSICTAVSLTPAAVYAVAAAVAAGKHAWHQKVFAEQIVLSKCSLPPPPLPPPLLGSLAASHEPEPSMADKVPREHDEGVSEIQTEGGLLWERTLTKHKPPAYLHTSSRHQPDLSGRRAIGRQ
ncbi:hypothetical protein B0T20DRAFT_389148 [Sordaria brevicollis]|uniref:Uncharacterized protein n=1 Tax=Sordaria brevicollis TaxID=83679 RepID=A0AAE0PQA7_SORBR|nr:hypothetical protein B0T20DRAFT_389148 [Sordaria brevicollis]